MDDSQSCVYYLSSTDCEDIHINNNGWDFTVDITPPISLPRGKGKFALISFNSRGVRNNQLARGLYVYTDAISDTGSYVRGSHKSLLRIVEKTNIDFMCNPFYIPAARAYIDRIRVYIRTDTGQVPSMKPTFVRCTLRLIL